jgi:hypothetical protein
MHESVAAHSMEPATNVRLQHKFKLSFIFKIILIYFENTSVL